MVRVSTPDGIALEEAGISLSTRSRRAFPEVVVVQVDLRICSTRSRTARLAAPNSLTDFKTLLHRLLTAKTPVRRAVMIVMETITSTSVNAERVLRRRNCLFIIRFPFCHMTPIALGLWMSCCVDTDNIFYNFNKKMKLAYVFSL